MKSRYLFQRLAFLFDTSDRDKSGAIDIQEIRSTVILPKGGICALIQQTIILWQELQGHCVEPLSGGKSYRRREISWSLREQHQVFSHKHTTPPQNQNFME